MSTIIPSNFDAPAEIAIPTQLDPMRLSSADDGQVLFSRNAYHRMAEAGILDPKGRFELIEGVVYMMSPIGPTQSAIVRRLTRFFSKRLPDNIDCSIQLPIFSGEHSEPQPDVALLRRRDDDYRDEHPSPKDVLLIIEVSQSSLSHDLGPKLELYAASSIQEYWVADIHRQAIIVHRDPYGGNNRVANYFGAGCKIAPIAAAECELDVTWLFR